MGLSALLRVTTGVKTPCLKKLGKKGVYSVLASTSLLISKGTRDRDSNRTGTWRPKLNWDDGAVLLAGLLPTAASACFLISGTCTSSPGMSHPEQAGLSGSVVWRHFPSSARTLACHRQHIVCYWCIFGNLANADWSLGVCSVFS